MGEGYSSPSFEPERGSGSPFPLAKPLGAAAVALGAAGVANLLLARRAERLHPAMGRFITVDGVRLHYLDRGTGPVVVLLHGNGTMAWDFVLSGLVAFLETDHRVIAFDRPGFGYSERPRSRVWTPQAQAVLLDRALRMLDARAATIVGHSWGTLVAISTALLDPEGTAGLVLLSGYYYPTSRKDSALMSWPAVPLLGDLMRYTVSPVLGRLMAPAAYRKMFAPAPLSPAFAHLFPTELCVRPSQIRAAAEEAGLMVAAAEGLAGSYAELNLPVAIVAGAGDEVVDVERHAGRLARDLPQSTLHEIPDSGHMVHYTEPNRVGAVINGIAQRQM
jgi:pimeloyl-ACP methyl ester carboxylesterase